MSCNNQQWRSIDYNKKYIHDLDDDHLINIIRYLTFGALKRAVTSAETKQSNDYFKKWIVVMETEAKRRGLDLDEIYDTLEHPDPWEIYNEKRKRAGEVPKKPS